MASGKASLPEAVSFRGSLSLAVLSLCFLPIVLWQNKSEGTTNSWLALNPHPAIVPLDNRFDDGQTQSCTADAILLLTLNPEKLVKDVLGAVHSQYQSRRDILYLIGWVQSGIMEVDFSESGTTGEDLILITWEIPVNEM